MASFTSGIGKGLREPVSPYRSAYVFGAGLNDVDADNWNAIPVIVEPATAFDLSRISSGHEVAVALLGIAATSAGTYQVTFRWYRDRDNALLYEFTFPGTAFSGGWLYGYSYLGWVDWEIKENGSYHLDITVTGPDSFSRTINFTVSGIPAVAPPAPVAVGFMAPITERLSAAAADFYAAWLEVDGWVWPFNLLSTPLYGLYVTFWWIAYHFGEFSNWINWMAGKAAAILGQADIFGLLRTWLDYASNAWSWVANAYTNVANIVNTWWISTSWAVRSWIDEAASGLQLLVDQLTASVVGIREDIDQFIDRLPALDELVSWWDNWTGNILLIVYDWWSGALVQVQGLINSAFVAREGLWSGWQDWRDKVTEFFSDPEEWLYKAADRIIERFW